MKRDTWHSNLARPSETETPIYYEIYKEYINMRMDEDDETRKS